MLSNSQAHYDYYILLGINELYTSEQRALCDKQKGPRYRAIRRARVERATPFNSAPFRVEPPACTSPPLSFQTYVAYSLSLQPTYSMYVWLLTCNLLEKNILSLWYGFSFEYRLHRYVLRDETNKTRPHLHIF